MQNGIETTKLGYAAAELEKLANKGDDLIKELRESIVEGDFKRVFTVKTGKLTTKHSLLVSLNGLLCLMFCVELAYGKDPKYRGRLAVYRLTYEANPKAVLLWSNRNRFDEDGGIEVDPAYPNTKENSTAFADRCLKEVFNKAKKLTLRPDFPVPRSVSYEDDEAKQP